MEYTNKLEPILRLCQEVATQSNDFTQDPIFVVERKRRFYGVDRDYADNTCWLDDDYEEIDVNDEYFNEATCTETGYVDQWDTIQWFFTKKAAEEFIEWNSHRMFGETRITTESLRRNNEMIMVREFLLSVGKGVLNETSTNT